MYFGASHVLAMRDGERLMICFVKFRRKGYDLTETIDSIYAYTQKPDRPSGSTIESAVPFIASHSRVALMRYLLNEENVVTKKKESRTRLG
jgi:hypothetical protein